MGRSMAPANAPSELAKVPKRIEIFNPQLNRHFEVLRQGSDIYQSEYELDEHGRTVFKSTHRLDYVVGAGQSGYTYLFRRGQWFFEAPLSYYSAINGWDLSPGYEKKDIGFTRPVNVACLACHNGQPEPVPKRDGMYQDPPFRFGEYAISCECCHGPGELHVREMMQNPRRNSSSGVDTSIVNPAKLPPHLADDICMYCHQGAEARILQPGKTYLDFRPGTRLYETLALFKRPVSEAKRAEADRLETQPPVRGSMETPLWWKNSSLQISKCYQASGGRLTCIACHSIHDPPTADNQVAYFRAKCMTCHADGDCKLPAGERMRHQPANDCVGCHMEKRAVAGIAHSSDTKHRIVRRPGQPLPDIVFEQPTPDMPGLLCLNKPEEDAQNPVPPLTKLIAYLQVMKREPTLHNYYLEVLGQLSQSAPQDPAVLVCLGMKALLEDKDYSQAADDLSQAIEHGNEEPTTFLYLGQALSRSGRDSEALRTFQRGVAAYPYDLPLRAGVAMQYLRLHDRQRALEAMRKHLELFPEDALMRGMMKKVEGYEP
jgi:tetratricopeptide (TPR) repeat protein